MAQSDDLGRPRKKKRVQKGRRIPVGPILFIVGVLIAVPLLFLGVKQLVKSLPPTKPGTLAERRTTSRVNMQEMMGRILNFDASHIFPTSGTVRDDGTPNLSWHVYIPPEQPRQQTGGRDKTIEFDHWFQRIDLSKLWDSPENKVAYAVQIPYFLNPEIPFQPNEFITHYAGNMHLFVPGKGLSIFDVGDGIGNTLAIGEVSTGFKSWGDPSNVRDPGLGLGKSPSQFGGPFPGGTFFVFADGHSNFISDKIDPSVLKALATPNGGEKMEKF